MTTFKRKAPLSLLAVALTLPVVVPSATHAGLHSLETMPEIRMFDHTWGSISSLAYGTIIVDGLPNETDWQVAQPLQDFKTFYDVQLVEKDTVIKTVYDHTAFYMLIQSDAEQTPPPAAERLFILLEDMQDEQKFYTIPVAVTADTHPVGISWNNWTGGEPFDSTQTFVNLGQNGSVLRHVRKETDGRWTVELKVPWSAIGSPNLAEQSELRLNVLRFYGAGASDPASSWVPVRQSVVIDDDRVRPYDQRSFTLHAGVANQGRLGSLYVGGLADTVPWQPEEASLRYKQFGEKVLQFEDENAAALSAEDIELVWIDPRGTETVLSSVMLASQGDTVQLTFAHPAPLADGLYRLKLTENGSGSTPRYAEFSFDREALIEAGNAHAATVWSPPASVVELVYAPPSTEVQQLLALVPDRVGFFAAGVPHNTPLGFRSANYTWSAASPDMITSIDTAQIVYPNATYPETHVLVVTNKKGQPVEYPYYEDASGKRYFLSAHVWHFQRKHAVTRTKELASSDPLGAARLLYRFSQAYEGWVRINDTIWNQYPMEGSTATPFNYYGGVWERWTSQELVGLRPLADALAEVDKTNAFALLSTEVGEDVRSKIVDGMIRPSVREMLSYPILNHNIEYSNWAALIQIGKALQEPAFVHEAVKRMEQFAASGFRSDGFWKEVTLSYHIQTANGLRGTANLATGWTDPPDYVSPVSGVRFEQLELVDRLPKLGAVLNVPNLLAYPNGKYVPVNDTWAFQGPTAPVNNSSLLMKSAGIAKLIQGTGADQTQLYLSFSPNNGHDHKDPLNLALYAAGQELLPDVGYTHTFYRQWTVSTLGHNTVVVDSGDGAIQGAGKPGGNIKAMHQFDSGAGGAVQVVQARQENAYTDSGVSLYEREPWLIEFADATDGSGYVVDLFRVHGGSRHEYTLNGDANREAEMTADAALTSYGPYLLEGSPTITFPNQETDTGSTSDNQYYGYIYVRDVQEADVPDGQYRLELTTSNGAAAGAALDIYGDVGAGDNRLFLGRSPSLRATRLNGLSGDNNAEAVLYDMPKFVLRKDGGGGSLQSQFIHVMEPRKAGATGRISDVTVLKNDESTGEAIVSVSYNDTTDIIWSAPGYSGTPLVFGDMTLSGSKGLIRLTSGAVTEMHVAGGTGISKGTAQLAAPGAAMVTGTIVETEAGEQPGLPISQGVMLTETIVPAEAVGQYLMVTHPNQTVTAYKIAGVERKPGASVTRIAVEGEPDFVYTDPPSALNRMSRLLTFPATVWHGTHTFWIDLTASLQLP